MRLQQSRARCVTKLFVLPILMHREPCISNIGLFDELTESSRSDVRERRAAPELRFGLLTSTSIVSIA